MNQWLGAAALALAVYFPTLQAEEWPQEYVLADGTKTEDGGLGIAVLDNRNLQIPADEAESKGKVNYLVDLRSHSTLIGIPGVNFSYHPDLKEKLIMEWADDSSWGVAQYIEHFGMTHLVLLQLQDGKWAEKKIEEQLQVVCDFAIEAKEPVPLNVWTGDEKSDLTLQLYAVGDDNPKSDPNQKTHPVVFSGRYDLKTGKWLSAKARAISQRDEDALLYFGRSGETPEAWSAKMDEKLNSVYRELKASLTDDRFRKLQDEQRAWVAAKAGNPAKENLRLAVRLHELRDLLARTLAEGE